MIPKLRPTKRFLALIKSYICSNLSYTTIGLNVKHVIVQILVHLLPGSSRSWATFPTSWSTSRERSTMCTLLGLSRVMMMRTLSEFVISIYQHFQYPFLWWKEMIAHDSHDIVHINMTPAHFQFPIDVMMQYPFQTMPRQEKTLMTLYKEAMKLLGPQKHVVY